MELIRYETFGIMDSQKNNAKGPVIMSTSQRSHKLDAVLLLVELAW